MKLIQFKQFKKAIRFLMVLGLAGFLSGFTADREDEFSTEQPPSGTFISGVFSVADLEADEQFAAWRGLPVTGGLLFWAKKNRGNSGWTEDKANWASNPIFGNTKKYLDAGKTPVLTIPLLWSVDSMNFNLVVSGAYDSLHTGIANKLFNDSVGSKKIFIRLGHEASGGYPWSITNKGQPNANPRAYKAAWSRIAKIYKTKLPGARLVWNHLKRHGGVKLKDYYPGTDVVDVISCDPYDNNIGLAAGDRSNGSVWWRQFLGTHDLKGRRISQSEGYYEGVGGYMALARELGKTTAWDEWSVSNGDLSPTNPVNSDFYTAKMVRVLKKYGGTGPGQIEFENLFNHGGDPNGQHQLWPRTPYNAKASDAYLAAMEEAFGSP